MIMTTPTTPAAETLTAPEAIDHALASWMENGDGTDGSLAVALVDAYDPRWNLATAEAFEVLADRVCPGWCGCCVAALLGR